MVEATNEFIVEMLRRIQADISDLKADVREVRGLMDRRDEVIERGLRRLELTDAPH